MSEMSLYNDVGEPTYTGERDIVTAYPALKQVVMYDESEGYAGWYIGYDGARLRGPRPRRHGRRGHDRPLTGSAATFAS